NVDRAKQLLEWSKRKADLDLADKSDLLQALSFVRLRELELTQGRSDLKTNVRQLNSLRGKDSDVLELNLEPVYLDSLLELAPVERAKVRQDVLAAKQDARIAHANARLGAEKNKPNFEAYISYAFTGRDSDLGTSYSFMPQGIYTLGVF